MPTQHSLPPFNEDLRAILGRPCFACAEIAGILRHDGLEIKTRAEDEQAAVLYWLLTKYLAHGENWREVAEATLRNVFETKIKPSIEPKVEPDSGNSLSPPGATGH